MQRFLAAIFASFALAMLVQAAPQQKADRCTCAPSHAEDARRQAERDQERRALRLPDDRPVPNQPRRADDEGG